MRGAAPTGSPAASGGRLPSAEGAMAAVSRRQTWRMRPGATNLRPAPATLRNSARRLSRGIAPWRAGGTADATPGPVRGLGGEPLAPLRAAGGEDLAPADRRQTGAEAMTALANDFAGLIGALHGTDSGYGFPLKQGRCIRERYR
jgi:hypothetical protein